MSEKAPTAMSSHQPSPRRASRRGIPAAGLRRWSSMTVALLACCLVTTLAGCGEDGFFIITNPSAGDDGGSDGGGDDTVGRSSVVSVRFLNSSSSAVDVEFHQTTEVLAVLPDDLLTEDYGVKRGIGVAGTGIIPPDASDTIEVACSGDLILGTAGGAFVDAETGDEFGRGQARWIEDSPLGLCGALVTFEYLRDGDQFRTRVSISH